MEVVHPHEKRTTHTFSDWSLLDTGQNPHSIVIRTISFAYETGEPHRPPMVASRQNSSANSPAQGESQKGNKPKT